MEYQDIIFEVKEGYAVLTFNKPKKLNALGERMKKEIADVLDVVDGDSSIRGLIITGSGRGFMAGTDLSEISTDRTGAETKLMSLHGQELMNRIEKLPKPVIAAVNGYALGGGTELALACDLRVAGEKAKFGVPESDLGVAPCYGGTQRLARLCGPAVAKDLLFTARQVGAEEALRIGLCDRVVEQDKLLEETENLMKTIIKNGPVALAACKTLVDDGLNMSFEAVLRYEAELNDRLADTEDAAEGLKAFFEKRPPVFKGK
ncbi:MAG: enoyl-CoA hydratase/isomerase family protein [Oscillospiraceae bacterium]|nr:enoyl-CoA hydratase/isomerase family protein [Oscillospiraceae bacterium]